VNDNPHRRALPPQGADEAVELLHGNGIKCAVANPVLTTFGSNQMGSGYTVIVADEDKKRAKEALEGMLAAKWFLRTSSGQRYHAFETATADEIREHLAEAHEPPGGWSTTDIGHLADLLDQHRHPTWEALQARPPLEGRTLDEWAVACGCEHVHTDVHASPPSNAPRPAVMNRRASHAVPLVVMSKTPRGGTS
jgi:hypothetical protein